MVFKGILIFREAESAWKRSSEVDLSMKILGKRSIFYLEVWKSRISQAV